MSKVIDAHSHYMPPEVAQKTTFFKVHWSDADRQLRMMDDMGIEKAMLFYPTSDAHLQMGGWANVAQIYNREIAALIRKHPDRFIGAGILPVDDEEALEKELAHIDGLDLKIISMASSYDGKFLDDEKFFPIFDYAQKRKRPVHIHSQIINPIGEERVRDPLLSPVLEYVFDVSMCVGKMMMGGVLEKFPDLKIIVAHYGGVLPIVKERFDNTYQMLRKRNFVKDLGKLPGDFLRNIFLDTSGSQSPASLLCALEMVDADHILFGSDFPANQNIRDSIQVIETAPLAEGQKKNILSGNALRVISA